MSEENDVEFDLLARVAEWVQATPDAVAVDAGDFQISYRALDLRAAAVAQALCDAGCKTGSLAAVWMEDRAALVSVRVHRYTWAFRLCAVRART